MTKREVLPIKTRNWWFVLYPESAPDDWFEILSYTTVPAAISPLHDKDIDDHGNPKKPHYHIMLRYPGPTTYNHVLELTRSLHQPIPQVYASITGAYDYLTHENNADKYHYDATDIKLINGFVLNNNESKANVMLKIDIINYIRSNSISEYDDLLYAIIDNGMTDWLQEVTSHAYTYVQLLRSIRFKRDQ